MHRVSAVRICLLFASVGTLVLGACSQPSSSRDGAETSGRSAQAAGGAAGASSISACSLLTAAEIQQKIGVAVDGGKLQTTNDQASCDWTGANGQDEVGVGVSVKDFDQKLWSTFASSSRATPVSGLGDAAFAHVPTKVTVMIKKGKYEIDVGIVDFKLSDDREMAAAQALAALVVARVS